MTGQNMAGPVAACPWCNCTAREMCGRFYTCECCLARVPWCFGAADDQPGWCDDCWAAFSLENWNPSESAQLYAQLTFPFAAVCQ
jgi:hypothetical protein